jgi:hypothetical protein
MHSGVRKEEYLGLDLEDMSNAMKQYAPYQKSPVEPKMAHFESSQIIGGQSGISVCETYWLEPVLNQVRFTTPDRELMK